MNDDRSEFEPDRGEPTAVQTQAYQRAGKVARAETAGTDEGLVYRTELRPHRSNTLKGVHTLMWLMAIIWVPVAVTFMVAGAWPVLPLMGLEVLLLYGLLRLNLRRGREVETIAVTSRTLTVERINHWGRRSEWTFQPQWMQILVDENRGRDSRLLLRSHGRTLTIGRFLTTAERIRVAEALRRAITDLRAPNLPAGQGA